MLCSQNNSSLHGFLHRRSTDGRNIKIPRSEKTTFSLLWVLWKFETYFIACPLDDYIWLDFVFCAGYTSFPPFHGRPICYTNVCLYLRNKCFVVILC